jgi:hypothetical protein
MTTPLRRAGPWADPGHPSSGLILLAVVGGVGGGYGVGLAIWPGLG